VVISPNFHPRDRSSRVLLWPWGAQVAALFVGRQRCFEPENAEQALHWTVCYPTSALLPMMALVEHVRTMPLDGVTMPILVAYSREDTVVDPEETRLASWKLAQTVGGDLGVRGPGRTRDRGRYHVAWYHGPDSSIDFGLSASHRVTLAGGQLGQTVEPRPRTLELAGQPEQ
jgi:hypothetical protein